MNQENADLDDLGDVCDTDDDNDGIPDDSDFCPYDAENDRDHDEICGNEDKLQDRPLHRKMKMEMASGMPVTPHHLSNTGWRLRMLMQLSVPWR